MRILALAGSGQMEVSSWQPLPTGVHRISAHWQSANSLGRALYWIDGTVMDSADLSDHAGLKAASVRVGAWQAQFGADPTGVQLPVIRLDNLLTVY